MLSRELAEVWNVAIDDVPDRHVKPLALDPEVVLLVGRAADEHLAALECALQVRGARTARVDVDRPHGRPSVLLGDALTPATCRAAIVREVCATRPLAHHHERALHWASIPGASGTEDAVYARAHNREAVLGWLDGLTSERWVNAPRTALEAESKLLQLRSASAAGLRIPRTLVTSDPELVRAFAASCPGGIVHKSLTEPVVWSSAGAGFLFTTAVSETDLHELDRLLVHDALFQERLRPRRELRVTVVGDRCFTAAITPIASELIDWRRALAARAVRYAVVTLPDDLRSRILGLMRTIGLEFAAIDLIEDDDGYVFLEVNPPAAYRWLEVGLGLPITEALCDRLLET